MGRPLLSHHQAVPMVAALGRRCITTRSKSGSTSSKIFRGNFLHNDRTRAPTALRYLPSVQMSGERPAAKPACGTPRAERSADASFPSTERRKPWLASPRARTRPCGFSRQGRGKRLGEEASCAASSRSPRSPKETHPFFADRRTRVCGKQQHNNQTIPVAAGKPVGTPVKVQQFTALHGKRCAYGLCPW